MILLLLLPLLLPSLAVQEKAAIPLCSTPENTDQCEEQMEVVKIIENGIRKFINNRETPELREVCDFRAKIHQFQLLENVPVIFRNTENGHTDFAKNFDQVTVALQRTFKNLINRFDAIHFSLNETIKNIPGQLIVASWAAYSNTIMNREGRMTVHFENSTISRLSVEYKDVYLRPRLCTNGVKTDKSWDPCAEQDDKIFQLFSEISRYLARGGNKWLTKMLANTTFIHHFPKKTQTYSKFREYKRTFLKLLKDVRDTYLLLTPKRINVPGKYVTEWIGKTTTNNSDVFGTLVAEIADELSYDEYGEKKIDIKTLHFGKTKYFKKLE